MSENPNPAVCGSCGTVNPPNQEFCVRCRAPLTLTAGADALAGTPESADELRPVDAGHDADTPDVIVAGGIGGAPIPMPAEPLDPDPDRPPRG